ncbi:hypothetical protein Tco_0512293 [Tanacetum coccineum]
MKPLHLFSGPSFSRRCMCNNCKDPTHSYLQSSLLSRKNQYVTKNCEPCGSNVHTKSDHNDIEVVSGKSGRGSESAGERRAGDVTSGNLYHDVPGPEGMYGNNSHTPLKVMVMVPKRKSTSGACQLLKSKLGSLKSRISSQSIT